MSSARLKAIGALGLVVFIIAAGPFDNKLLLAGLLWVPSGVLVSKIEASNEFLLRSAFSFSWKGILLHPWVPIVGVLVLWALAYR